MRAFLVRLPSLVRYWTVVDDSLSGGGGAEIGYLRSICAGQGALETDEGYAGALALYLRWCEQTSRDWRTGG